MQAQIASTVRDFVAENLLFGQPSSSISETDSFIATGILDSTDVLTLITFLEESFAIQVADNEVVPENLDSIAQIAAFVNRKKGIVEN